MKELLVLMAIGVPGLGLLIGGLKVMQRAGHPGLGGLFLVACGALLLLSAAYYHYRTDYAHLGRKKGIAAIVSMVFLSAFIGLLTSGTLFRLLK